MIRQQREGEGQKGTMRRVQRVYRWRPPRVDLPWSTWARRAQGGGHQAPRRLCQLDRTTIRRSLPLQPRRLSSLQDLLWLPLRLRHVHRQLLEQPQQEVVRPRRERSLEPRHRHPQDSRSDRIRVGPVGHAGLPCCAPCALLCQPCGPSSDPRGPAPWAFSPLHELSFKDTKWPNPSWASYKVLASCLAVEMYNKKQ